MNIAKKSDLKHSRVSETNTLMKYPRNLNTVPIHAKDLSVSLSKSSTLEFCKYLVLLLK